MRVHEILRRLEELGDPFAALGLSRDADDTTVAERVSALEDAEATRAAAELLATPALRARVRLLLPVPATDLDEIRRGVKQRYGYVGPGPWRRTIDALARENHRDSTCNRSR